jgi:hypothetical protein
MPPYNGATFGRCRTLRPHVYGPTRTRTWLSPMGHGPTGCGSGSDVRATAAVEGGGGADSTTLSVICRRCDKPECPTDGCFVRPFSFKANKQVRH